MSLNEIAGAANPTTTQDAPSRTARDRQALGESFDQFLTLLTTQLQHQDPLSPMDSAEFTNQLVLFSQVEQQIAQNDKLEKLLQQQNALQTQAALGFIGLDAEVRSDQIAFAGAPVAFNIQLDQPSRNGEVHILDALGRTVRVLDAPTDTTKQTLTWDGRDNLGETVAHGTYRIAVRGQSVDGEALDATTTILGRITGIDTSSGDTVLMMGDRSVPIDDVLSARRPPSTSGG